MAFNPTTKYVKNDTGSTSTYQGQDIAAGAYYLIPKAEELEWSQDSDVIQAILDGDLIVSSSNQTVDNIVDTTQAIDYLKDITAVSFNSNNELRVDATISTGCPTMGNNLRIEFDDTDISITSETVYAELYSYSGTGNFIGAVWDFDSNKVKIRLTVDSAVIFDLKFQDIEDIARFGGNKNGQDRDIRGMFRIGESDRLEFCPPCPIKFSSNVTVDAIKTSSSSKKLKEKMTFIEKTS